MTSPQNEPPNAPPDLPTTDQSIPQTPVAPSSPRKPLRLWPGVIGGTLVALGWFIVPMLVPAAALYAMLAGVLGVLVILVWWLLFSRARWFERLGAVALTVLALYVTSKLIHISILNGAMGNLFFVLSIPVIALTLAVWAVVTQRLRLTDGVRRASLVIAILLVCGAFTLLRTGGITANFDNDIHWRWTKTPEEQLLAQGGEEPAVALAPAVLPAEADWPGFRGPARDGIVRATAIKTDWAASPPTEVWRRPIGPGWSSFAVNGDLIYTQEQRGAEEVVACYNLATGKLVWKHGDPVRFWESNAGAGPRGTPTLSNGRVYTLGGTGIVNVLDASKGSVVWSRNAASDTGTKTPIWGFSGSPLVIDDIVVVAAAGNLIGYSSANGEQRWSITDGGSGYSSPQLFTIGGVPQIVLLGGAGATGVAPKDGTRLWRYPLSSNTRIVQPALTADGDVLVHDGESNGMRRLAVTQGSGGWTVTERWTSEGLNPYFSDFVVHKGHAYGFDASNISCIDLKDGQQKWKGGNYGHGQLVLLQDQDLLLVISEQGELALVGATADQFKEFGRVPAIKGKTWNHPVLVKDIVLVRNGEEMGAFRLAREKLTANAARPFTAKPRIAKTAKY